MSKKLSANNIITSNDEAPCSLQKESRTRANTESIFVTEEDLEF